ncbi:serine protease inhibitor [Arthrobacter sp. USHLN218]|uniref:serine protease inhibitor n=1 Tax=Arthrobacter sp. USHLN218 TaxID=3081232 RepID=UPI0030164510
MDRKRAGSRTALALLSVPAALALLLSGCAPGGEGPGETSPPASQPASSGPGSAPPSSPAEGAPVDAKLKISVSTSGADYKEEKTLVCVDSQPMESSTVQDPDAACAALVQHAENVFFTQPDPNRSCTQQYGGPQQAHVTGTIDGREVNKTFTLTDGCKISEWNAMQDLLGGAAGKV